MLVSNEIVAESPKLEFGKPSFAFEAEPLSDAQSDLRESKGCASENKLSIDCRVFKYRILNLSARAVRNFTYSCSESGVFPEYRNAEGQWTPLPQVSWVCTMNIVIETPILSGKAYENEFTLANLAPGYDLTPLRAPGEHQLRFRFSPYACFASPDGRFCLTGAERQQPVVSSEVIVRTP